VYGDEFGREGENRADAGEERFEADGFGEIAIDSLGFREGSETFLILTAHHDDPDARVAATSEVFEDGHAAPAGHDEIEDDEVGAVAFGPHHAFLAVACFKDFVTGLREDLGDALAKGGVIINQKNSAVGSFHEHFPSPDWTSAERRALKGPLY